MMKLHVLFSVLLCQLFTSFPRNSGVIADDVFVICREPDSYEVHEDCTKFYQCSNGVPYELDCPSGRYFNPDKKECDDPENVPACQGGTRDPVLPTVTPNPTTAESKPTTEESRPTTKESRPTTEESIPTTAESIPTTEVSRPTTEESRPTTAESRPTTEESRPTTEESRPTTEQSRPTTVESRPTTEESRPTTEESRPTTAESIPTTEVSRPTTEESRPTTEESRPTTEVSRPTTEESRPTTEESRPTTEESRPTTEESRPTTEVSRPTTEESRPTTEVSRPTTEVSRPTTEESRPTTEESKPTTEQSRPTTFQPTTGEYHTTPYTGICPPLGIHRIPYPGNCSLYYFCINGKPTIESCAVGLLFDPVTRDCKKVNEVECVDQPSTTEQPNICPEEGRHFLPYPGNCSLYIVCDDGLPYYEECSPGYLFDPVLGKCNLPDLVECEYAVPTCPDDGIVYMPVQGSCVKYVFCFNGVPNYLACGEGLVFDPNQKLCVFESEYDCPYARILLRYLRKYSDSRRNSYITQ